MPMTTKVATSLGLFMTLGACSLIVDTNPDGVVLANHAGSAGRSTSSAGSSTTAGTVSNGGLGLSGAGTASTLGGAPAAGASNLAGGGSAGSLTATGGVSGLGGNYTSAGTTATTGGTGATAGRTGGVGGITAAGTGGVATGGVAGGGTGGVATGGIATGGVATGGKATGGAATGGVATGGTGVGGCPGTGGPTMVALPEGYCIDSTEVTRAQYAAWLKTTTIATIGAQDQTTCGWNMGFDPAVSYPNCVLAMSCDTACDNRPQRCVDWCDAVAYCKSMGKRLCGKIGGGALPYASSGDPTVSQWANACSSHGANSYPYGNTYEPTYCNGPELPSEGDLPVRTYGNCQAAGPYASVFDLSGNVQEFVDSCESASPDAMCRAMGGGAWNWYMANPDDYPAYMSCGRLNSSNRNIGSTSVGIRCCAP